jgi:predicted MFS family arabinose efflux permease
VEPKPGAPSWLGLSPTVWLISVGLLVIWLFLRWQARLEERGGEPLVRPTMLQSKQLTGGLTMFFFQFLVQAGVFFVVPLFLSVVLGLSALDTGVRLLPLSVTLLAAALGIPRFLPDVSPRLVVRLGIFSLLLGTVVLLVALDADAGPEIVFVPMLLLGLGIGALSSQLGAVTVSAVPDEQAAEVGGLQNTVTNLGASLGTALAGSVLIASLTTAFLTNIQASPAIPASVKSQATTELAGGIPFLSDADLEEALDEAGASDEVTQAAVDANADARLEGLRAALTILAVLALIALFFTQRIPAAQPRAGPT